MCEIDEWSGTSLQCQCVVTGLAIDLQNKALVRPELGQFRFGMFGPHTEERCWADSDRISSACRRHCDSLLKQEKKREITVFDGARYGFHVKHVWNSEANRCW